jgi:hypothetical protein
MKLGFQSRELTLNAYPRWHWAEAYRSTFRVTGTWLSCDLAWILT